MTKWVFLAITLGCSIAMAEPNTSDRVIADVGLHSLKQNSRELQERLETAEKILRTLDDRTLPAFCFEIGAMEASTKGMIPSSVHGGWSGFTLTPVVGVDRIRRLTNQLQEGPRSLQGKVTELKRLACNGTFDARSDSHRREVSSLVADVRTQTVMCSQIISKISTHNIDALRSRTPFSSQL